MESQKATYESYHGMVAKVNTALANIAELCGKLDMTDTQKKLEESSKNLLHNRFSVGIMGEFNRGKSTVINSLLGQEIMPADILPCSATMNRVTYDTKPHAEVIMNDGTVREIDVDGIAEYVTKTNQENADRAAMVDQAVVYYPCVFCQNGVDIVDTPGLNDDERMERISEEIIAKLDAVIMVIVPGAPFSMSEANFVRNKLMVSDIGRLMFVVNKIDCVRRNDRERVIAHIRETIQKTILDKTAEIYGTDSSEYEETRAKLGNIKIYPISALDALDGRMGHDEALIEGSGIKEFEDGLTHMLTTERGILQLIAPLKQISSACGSVISNATAMKESQKLSAEEFAQRQSTAIEKIDELREKKKTELLNIKAMKNETVASVKAQVPDFYNELEGELLAVAEQTVIDKPSLKKQAGQEAALNELSNKVSGVMNERISIFCESMMGQARHALEEQMADSSQFLGLVSVEMDDISMSFSLDSKKDDARMNSMLSVAGALGEVATTFLGFGGVSGAVEGWKEGGIPGALAGAATGFAAVIGTALLCSSIGLVGLPFLAISTIASGVSGKFVGHMIGKFFGGGDGNKEYKEVMESVRTTIRTSVANMRNDQRLEGLLETRITESFERLRTMVDEEAEKMLNESQKSIDMMKENLTKSKLEQEQISKRCDEMIAGANRVLEDIKPIADKVRESRQTA